MTTVQLSNAGFGLKTVQQHVVTSQNVLHSYPMLVPSRITIEDIKLVPSVCVCQLVSALPAKPFDLG